MQDTQLTRPAWMPVPPAAPVHVGPVTAMRMRPFLTLLPVLLLLAPALAWSLLRSPVYTSESRLVVGDLGFTAQAVPGYVLASQQMAETYARLASSGVVIDAAARKLHLPVADVGGALTSTSIPESAIVVIDARTVDAGQGIRIVQAAAEALETLANGGNDSTKQLLDDYGTAAAAVQDKQAALARAKGAYDALHAKDPTDASSAAQQAQDGVNKAQAAYDQAKLRADSLAYAYQQGVQGTVLSGSKVRIVSHGMTTANDRLSRVEFAVIAALAIGSVLGAALVTLRANPWRTNRSHADAG